MTTKSKGKIFVEHIERHLAQMPPLHIKKEVICKICGKTVDQIYAEENKNSRKNTSNISVNDMKKMERL